MSSDESETQDDIEGACATTLGLDNDGLIENAQNDAGDGNNVVAMQNADVSDADTGDGGENAVSAVVEDAEAGSADVGTASASNAENPATENTDQAGMEDPENLVTTESAAAEGTGQGTENGDERADEATGKRDGVVIDLEVGSDDAFEVPDINNATAAKETVIELQPENVGQATVAKDTVIELGTENFAMETVAKDTVIELGTENVAVETVAKDTVIDIGGGDEADVGFGSKQALVEADRQLALLGSQKKTRPLKQILSGISAYFNPGELVAIMGPSGCGKTTLLDLLTSRRKTGYMKVRRLLRYINYNPFTPKSISSSASSVFPAHNSCYGKCIELTYQ